MAPEPESRALAIGLVALMGLSAAAALFVLLRGGGGRSAPAAPSAGPARRAARAWPEADMPRVQDPAMIQGDAERSGLEMVQRPPEAAPGQQEGVGAATTTPPAARTGGTPAPEAPGAAAGLSDAERAQLGRLAGRDLLDPRKAAEVGASDGLWSAALKAVAAHPRLMSFILNNDAVVKAFMSRPASQQNCRSASAFTAYLSDTKRPNGVSHAMDVFSTVLHGHGDMPTVMFSSKLGAAIQDCPSVKSMVKDQGAITQIAQANPRMLHMMLDPALMKGLAASPQAMASFQSVQNNLGQ